MKFNEWEIGTYNKEAAERLCSAGYSPLAAAVLCSRGYERPDEVQAFLSAGEELYHDPLLLRDMDKAVNRIRKAVLSGEKIAVYGDYDVDGVTSTCLAVCCLQELGAQCEYYIPARIEEGYGLNPGAIDILAGKGVKLIVTVDCGVTAFTETKYALSLGIDMVITDHHRCQGALPEAAAVVNPFRPDDEYPNKGLAGVGVAFKLACALLGEHRAMEYIDLVALGTVADVMPLVGENRAIVKKGLELMSASPRPGILSLMRETGLRSACVSAADIAFLLAPRINAAGRMGQVCTAVELLLTQESEHADILASSLSELNKQRQSIETKISMEARAMLTGHMPGEPIVLASSNWHHGVIGIVSSKLAEEYRCRVFLISLLDGVGKASCRSFRGQSVIAAIEAASDYVVDYGGHEMAAGFTVLEENIPALAAAVGRYAREHRAQDEAGSRLKIDCAIENMELITTAEIDGLGVLQPYGHGNPPPVFYMEDVEVDRLFMVGAQKDHMKLTLTKDGGICGGIYFSQNPISAQVCPGDLVDIAFILKINEFRGARAAQIQLVDIRPCGKERQKLAGIKQLLVSLESGELSGKQARQILPQREDFAALWRCISTRMGENYTTSIWSLSKEAADTKPGKVLVCLRVFQEMGLVHLLEQGRLVNIKVLPFEGKADLDRSALLSRISQSAALK